MKKMIAVCMFTVLGLAGWSLTTTPTPAECRAELQDCILVGYEVCGSNSSCLYTWRTNCFNAYTQCGVQP